ncbi:MAG: type I-F CRISPR-associated helicase Cas3, partial [Alcaligenaceae bacterium]|nr:type I-F CRISPR-associated helicase Cas3 [Alcaligenaceae bacterium]
MMVVLVSQCEKNALAKTRRVLDAFADRIGDNTWQTVITEEGLQAVKKLLRKTASKSTAVSCHWIRSRSRSDLLWIVGNRRKFNKQGIVPVNYTEMDVERFFDKEKWQSLEVIKNAAAIAALFHDFGKANILFQQKLKGEGQNKYEPVRHEWVSLRIFQAFVGNKSDEQWLIALTEIDKNHSNEIFQDGITPGRDNP